MLTHPFDTPPPLDHTTLSPTLYHLGEELSVFIELLLPGSERGMEEGKGEDE